MKKMFMFKNIDTHYVIVFFGIQFTIRHKSEFNYKKAVKFGITEHKRTPQLIVSLTTFPARINDVALTINTLLRQNVKPDRLILWLAEEQFLDKNILPKELHRLERLGLEIKWCEDIKSYKKLIPTLKLFPDDIVVTADDDMYYKEDWLEGLYNAYLEKPFNVYTRRGCRIEIKNNQICVLKPRDYNMDYSFPVDFNNLLMGGAGALYPPHSLHNDIFNIEQIKTLIPTHDDIYFWTMAVLNNTRIGVVGGFDYSFYYTEASENNGLSSQNKKFGEGLSPKQAFDKICKKYPELIEKLKNQL